MGITSVGKALFADLVGNVTGAAHPHLQMEMSKAHESVSDHIDHIEAPHWMHLATDPRRRQSDYRWHYCKQ